MPEETTYKYDIFISYSSADKPWAERLFDSLSAKGISCFFDRERLEAGLPWEPQLAQAVEHSRHLVALWSNKAQDSAWVRRELGKFEAIVDPTGSGQLQVNRRFIFFLLEGQNPAYAGMQMITGLKEADAYSHPMENLDQGVWRDSVERVETAISADDNALRVPLAILSMRKSDIAGIDPDEPNEFGPSLNELLNDFGIGTIKDLEQYYGDERTDWRPYGSPNNIWHVLDMLKDEINLATHGPKFRWEPIDNEFWTNIETAKREKDRLLTSLSLIVIDPISLFDSRVYNRLVMLSQCFESENALIMVLTPFTTPQHIVNLRGLIEKRGYPFFEHFFEPPIPIESYASCGVNIGDDRDFKRLLCFSLGHYVRRRQPPSKPPYLRVG
jgi:TIR domain